MILPPLPHLANIACIDLNAINKIYYLKERGEVFHHLSGEPIDLKNYLHLIVDGEPHAITISLIGYNVHTNSIYGDRSIAITPADDPIVQAIREVGSAFETMRVVQTEEDSFSIECVYDRSIPDDWW